jgi:hypothetical protein
VVVVNWNGRAVLPDCLDSLHDAGDPDLRVVLVDNASSDDSVAWTRARHPRVEVIETGANLRWAGGNNAALARLAAEGWPHDHVLLLNNDTVVQPGSLTRLGMAVTADPRAWVATPRIAYAAEPRRLWYDGGRVGAWTGWIRHEGIRQPATGRETTPRLVEYGTGCALLLTRRALQRCGLLDTVYHFYGEDVDYCLRVRRAGGGVLHVPSAVILHKVSASLGAESPRKAYLRSRSHVRLLRRHWPRSRWWALLPAQVAYHGAHGAWHCWHGRVETARALVDGVLDELRGRPDAGTRSGQSTGAGANLAGDDHP